MLTGHVDVALVRDEFLLEPGVISLEFPSALGFFKPILAWIRVVVLSSKNRVLFAQRDNHAVFL